MLHEISCANFFIAGFESEMNVEPSLKQSLKSRYLSIDSGPKPAMRNNILSFSSTAVIKHIL